MRRIDTRHHDADLKFLEKLRTATLDELHALALRHCGKGAPKWKQVAIERAIRRYERDRTDRASDRAA